MGWLLGLIGFTFFLGHDPATFDQELLLHGWMRLCAAGYIVFNYRHYNLNLQSTNLLDDDLLDDQNIT